MMVTHEKYVSTFAQQPTMINHNHFHSIAFKMFMFNKKYYVIQIEKLEPIVFTNKNGVGNTVIATERLRSINYNLYL